MPVWSRAHSCEDLRLKELEVCDGWIRSTEPMATYTQALCSELWEAHRIEDAVVLNEFRL